MSAHNHFTRETPKSLIIALLAATLSLSGCFLNSQGTHQCDEENSFVVGCFVHPEGEAHGIVIVEDVSLCLLSGTGTGLTELGLPPDLVWGFEGEGDVPDTSGGVLHQAHISISAGREGLDETMNLDIFHMVSADGTETLMIRDVESINQVTLDRRPCR